jgi:hypothetical protein
MTISDLASVGSLISGLGVLISLLYLASQVRLGMRATRSQIHQNILTGWLGLSDLVATNARTFSAGIAATAETFAAMSDADKLAYIAVIFVFFKHFENSFLQYQEGVIRSEDWNAWTNQMLMYWKMPGVQLFWKMRRDAFSPAFVRFVEGSHGVHMPSTTDIFSMAGGADHVSVSYGSQ